ncbi:MAG: hypothetical protein JWR60_4196, partial [Polaromonas sp.]|nr:hypothetical protein [Polaromonas sp.]
MKDSTLNARRAPPVRHGHSAAAQAPAEWRYLVSVLAGLLGALGAFYALLFTLEATGDLPPPAFSNSLCVDEKLSFMRENTALSPNLLVVGSSVAWRHFDGATLQARASGMKPLNGGFCGLTANQSVHVANWLLDRQPTVRQVVMIVTPQDFSDCINHKDAVFDVREADDFVYGGASRWPYYLRYFSPVSLLGNARRVKDRRTDSADLDPLIFTRFGDGPVTTSASLPTLGYGRPDMLEPSCFQALGSLAQRLQQEGRQLTVVSTPLHPDWKAKEDPSGAFLKDFDARLMQALKGTNARYWDADDEWKPDRSAFT